MNEDNMTQEEAGNNGAKILEHLKGIYDLVGWDDNEDGYIKTVIFKNGKIEVSTHLDEENELEPTVFEMQEIEEAEAAAENGE